MGFMCAATTAALITIFVGYQGVNPKVSLIDKSTCLANQARMDITGFAVDSTPIDAHGDFEVYVKYRCVQPLPDNLCADRMNPLIDDTDKLIALDDALRILSVKMLSPWSVLKLRQVKR